jgi:hypothetical protein
MDPDGDGGGVWLRRAVVTGAVVVLVLYGVAWVVGASLRPLQVVGRSAMCAGNVRQLVRGARLYSDDYGECLPGFVGWMDSVLPYLDGERRLHCAEVGPAGGLVFGYALNWEFGGKAVSKIAEPERSLLVYDSTNLGRSVFDGGVSLPSPGRHMGRVRKGEPMRRGNWLGFVDGHGAFR